MPRSCRSRGPGAYIATALDEMSGEPVGTTGAVLTAGEELRPTRIRFRALLARIAELTGGKVRDTLAGSSTTASTSASRTRA